MISNLRMQFSTLWHSAVNSNRSQITSPRSSRAKLMKQQVRMFQTSSLSNSCNGIITGFTGCTQIWKEMAHHLQKCWLFTHCNSRIIVVTLISLKIQCYRFRTVFILALQRVLKNVSKDYQTILQWSCATPMFIKASLCTVKAHRFFVVTIYHQSCTIFYRIQECVFGTDMYSQ